MATPPNSNAMKTLNNTTAMMVKNSDAKTDLVAKLKKLLKDKAMQELMHNNLQALAIKDADERIAKTVLEISGKKL